MTDARVAIVWRGDADAPDALQPETGRLKAIFAALSRAGLRPEPAPYDERHSGTFTQRLHEVDAALVWVNPLDKGRNRKALDDILREVTSAGVYVSAHPDVIAKMGVKAVLLSHPHAGVGERHALLRESGCVRGGVPQAPRRRSAGAEAQSR